MRILNWFPGIAALVLCSLLATAQADEPAKHQLSSIGELDRLYERTVLAQSKNGLECFCGRRKDLNPKYPSQDEFHIFDKNSLQVWPLRSAQISKNIAGCNGMGGAVFDSGGSNLGVLPWFYAPSTGTMRALCANIVLINLRTLECQTIVGDGCLNYNPSFSPDGRFIAYYATDRRTNPQRREDMPLKGSAGRVVNVQTKEITTITDYVVLDPPGGYGTEEGYYLFSPPAWLDNHRVLFSTVATDPALIATYAKGFSGKSCAYLAVADTTTGEIRRLLLPSPKPTKFPASDFDVTVNAGAKRLILCDVRRIIQTDFDLNNPTVIATAGENEVIRDARVVNGQVKYSRMPWSPPK